jgi:hypothetical protein
VSRRIAKKKTLFTVPSAPGEAPALRGGLIAMGHPFARQLRGEAGVRQQPGARLGLAHMVGLGQVCLIHILRAPGT